MCGLRFEICGKCLRNAISVHQALAVNNLWNYLKGNSETNNDVLDIFCGLRCHCNCNCGERFAFAMQGLHFKWAIQEINLIEIITYIDLM